MRKLSDWFRSHPIIAGCIAFLALCACLHFFLNWRAERRWQAYAKEARARGVKLNLTDFAPPKIPDKENFAALPMMRAMMKPGAKSPMAWPPAYPPSFGDPLKGERLDWEKWQAYFKNAGFISETTDSAPRDVLRALEHYAPQFREWSEWRTRPRCRFDLDYKDWGAIRLPNYSLFQDAARLFTLRMLAHLALGESALACGTFNEGFQAYRSLLEDPIFHSVFVRVDAISLLVDGVGEGLANNVWKENDLKKMDGAFASVRVWNDYRLSMSCQRSIVNWIHESCIGGSLNGRVRLINATGFGPPVSFPLAWGIIACIPRRVYRDNQLRSNQYLDEMLTAVSADGARFNPHQPTPPGPDTLSEINNLFLVLFRYSTSDYAWITNRFARNQTKLDQARIAIAIARFQMARRTLPETLSDMVPEFIAAIPDDVYGGKPMVYRRDEAGKFILYSVGENRSDDGGVRDSRKSAASQPDWVWPYQ